jgi:hypothetical protein
MELHRLHGRGVDIAIALTPLHTQITELAGKIGGMANVPEATKTQFIGVQKEFDAVRVKFGVPLAPPDAGGRGGRGGGGRGGGPAVNPANILARTATVKTRVMSFYDVPSDAMMAQAADIRATFPKAVAEVNAFLTKASALSQALEKAGVTLKVPAAIK